MQNLYRVEVTEQRRSILWVVAETEEDALEDAEELSCSIQDSEWDHDDMDFDVEDCTKSPPPNGVMVWSGGESGEERPWTADLLENDL